MNNIETHHTAQEFLKAHAQLFAVNQVRANMTIGNCHNLLEQPDTPAPPVFLSTRWEGTVHAVSVRISPKVMVNAFQRDQWSGRSFSGYYLLKQLDVCGVIGDEELAGDFASSFTGKDVASARRTHVMALEGDPRVLVKATGRTITARPAHEALLTGWTKSFLEDELIRPLRTHQQVAVQVSDLIARERFFICMVNEEPVSMAAVIRQSADMAVVGLVYTPPQHRGKGYARMLMHDVSAHIRSLKKCSALLVYGDNRSALRIYREMGYQYVSTYMDIDFKA